LLRVRSCDRRPRPLRKRCGIDTYYVARRTATDRQRRQNDQGGKRSEPASHDSRA
jgi:hypothetical protein